MRKSVLALALFLAPLGSMPFAFSQEIDKSEAAKAPKPEQHFYRLVFVVQELNEEGKPVNGRSYTTTVETESHPVQIRTSGRIPVPLPAVQNGSVTLPTQFQYVEVGIKFDIREVHELGKQLTFQLQADVDSMPPSSDPNAHYPVTRHNQWDAQVLVPVGKPAPVFTSDSLDSKGSMQVVVTATPLQ